MKKEEMNIENATVPEGFDWSAKSDPNTEADNYFQYSVSGELSDEFGQEQVSKRVCDAFRADSVKHQGDAIRAIPSIIAEITGEPTEFSRRDMLLIFAGFKMGTVSESCCGSQTDLMKTFAAALFAGR